MPGNPYFTEAATRLRVYGSRSWGKRLTTALALLLKIDFINSLLRVDDKSTIFYIFYVIFYIHVSNKN